MTRPPHGDHDPMPLIDLGDVPPGPGLACRQEQARKRREAADRERMYRDHHHAVTA